MIEALGQLGAEFAKIALGFALLAGSGFLAVKIIGKRSEKWSENRSCLTTGALAALIFFALAIVFGPAYGALQKVACGAANDYQACLDGD